MRLTDIQEEWKKDSILDELDLGKEALKISSLHAKYLSILSNTKLQLRKAESDYNSLRRVKYRYYRGELSFEELVKLGWDQYQGSKPLKNEMDEFLVCDEDLNAAQDKLEYFKTVVYTLEQIIRSLNSRTWDVKNCVEWNKFTNGAF